MKKVWYFFLVFFLIGILSVNADACKGKELSNLQKEADDIKINYEIVETKTKVKSTTEDEFSPNGFETEVTKDSIRITIYNLTKNVFLIQKDNKTNNKKTITYNDTNNGNYSFETDNLYELVNYNYEVYSNVDSCDLTLIKTINFVKPKRNSYYDYDICQKNLNVPVCQKYVTSDVQVTEANLYDYVLNQSSNNKEYIITSKEVNDENNSGNNLKYILFGTVLIAGIIYVIISRKRSTL